MTRAKRRPLRNARLPAPRAILRPHPRHVQADIDQRMFTPRDLAQKNPHLAVIGLAQTTAPLSLHADRLVPFLGERRRIEDEHRIGFADLLADLGGECAEERLVIPRHLTDELLDPLAIVIVEVGDAFAGLGGERGEEPLDVLGGVRPLFGFCERLSEGLEELVELSERFGGHCGRAHRRLEQFLSPCREACVHDVT
jgi:hypothetical protein